ncbi:hypothetical protein [Arthrobacter sp. KBS0703]|nr:hypothetical protein [Arthrobacter sp. KBS0703]
MVIKAYAIRLLPPRGRAWLDSRSDLARGRAGRHERAAAAACLLYTSRCV